MVQDDASDTKSQQRVQFDSVSMSNVSQEKSSKRVTFADPVSVYSEDL